MAKRSTKNRCRCGCGDTPKGKTSRFCIGHDARFHGRVAKLADGRLKLADLKQEVEAYAVPLYRKAVKAH